jgi:HSP20 family protein
MNDKDENKKKRKIVITPPEVRVDLSSMNSMFDPFKEGPLQNMHNRFFSQYFSDVTRAPKVDLADNGDSFTVTADMPGVEKKDIKLKVMRDSISISASSMREKETKTKNYYSKERSSSGYFRTVPMPEEIRSETAKAKYENGTLRIDVKKAKPSESGMEVQVD